MTTNAAGEAKVRIINKAVEDADFRAQLLADPRSAISAELGQPIPEGFTIHVHEESATTVHLTLPVSDQLAEEELAAVAGGEGEGLPWDWVNYGSPI